MDGTAPREKRASGPWIKALALAVASAGLMFIGRFFVLPSPGVILLWPVNAMTMAVLICAPKRHWPAYLAAYYAAFLIVSGMKPLPGHTLVLVALLGGCSCLEVFVGAWLITFLAPGPFTPLDVRSAARFVLACAVIGPFTGILAASLLVSMTLHGINFFQFWIYWFVTASGAVLLLVPPVLSWRASHEQINTARRAEIAAAFPLFLVTALAVFLLPEAGGGGVFLPYLVFPLIIWAAFRLPTRWALTAWPVFCLTGIACEAFSLGPFEATKSITNATSMQALFAMGSFTLLMLLAVHSERTRARNDLARSEELHRHILEGINDAVLLCDAQGNLTYVCPSVNVIFGYTPQQIMALGNIGKLLGPDLYDPAELQERGLIENAEREVSDNRGRTRFLLVTIKKVDSPVGTLLFCCRDITRRRLTENALRRSFQRLEDRIRDRTAELESANKELSEVIQELEREIGERARVERALRFSEAMLTRAQRIAKIGCWEREYETDKGYWSDEYYRILGYEPGKVESSLENFLNRVHPDERKEIESFIRAAVYDKRSYTFECRIVMDDGSIRHLYSQAELSEKNGKTVGHGTLQDITERKLAEIRLNETRELLLSVLDQMPAAVMVADAEEMRIQLVNRVASEIAGLDEQELIRFSRHNLPSWKTFKPDGSPWNDASTWPLFAAVLTGEVSRDVEMLIEQVDGRRTWLLFNGAPVRDAQGRIVAGVVVYQDISARKSMENQLIEARLAAEDASRAKSEFLANMSHEIRTPISGIIGMTDMALARRPSPEQREYLSTIKQTTGSLLRIVNDILDFSKIEARRMTIDHVAFDPSEVVRETIKTFSAQAENKGLELTAEIEPGLPASVAGDPDRLTQILRNLISNAVKFTDTGRVVLRAGSLGREEEHVRLFFEVQDTGPGIDKRDLPYLFEAFSQADTSYAKRFQGTGLGLAISRRLAEIMGGGLLVCSEPGLGSLFRFTVLLQAAEPESEPERLLADERIDPARPLSVLLAEDNAVNRTFIEFFLTEAGHKVTCVEDGVQALLTLAEIPFDVVIMDVQMPNLDGDEAAKRIRDGSAGALDPDVPIIALTAYAMKGDKERFLVAGMDEYLSKPVDPDAIMPALLRALKKKDRLQ